MTLTDKVIDLIIKMPLFLGFNDTEVETFLSFTGTEQYSSKSVIIREGERGTRLYILESGVAAVVTPVHVREDLRKKQEKKYKILAQLKEGDFFGEIGLFTSSPRSASVVAASPVTVYHLGENERDDFENRHPDICCKFYHNLLGEMSRRIIFGNEAIRAYYQAVNRDPRSVK